MLLVPDTEIGALPVLSFEQRFVYFKFSFPSCVWVGGLGFEFRMFVAGWRHAFGGAYGLLLLLLYHSGYRNWCILYLLVCGQVDVYCCLCPWTLAVR